MFLIFIVNQFEWPSAIFEQILTNELIEQRHHIRFIWSHPEAQQQQLILLESDVRREVDVNSPYRPDVDVIPFEQQAAVKARN